LASGYRASKVIGSTVYNDSLDRVAGYPRSAHNCRTVVRKAASGQAFADRNPMHFLFSVEAERMYGRESEHTPSPAAPSYGDTVRRAHQGHHPQVSEIFVEGFCAGINAVIEGYRPRPPSGL